MWLLRRSASTFNDTVRSIAHILNKMLNRLLYRDTIVGLFGLFDWTVSTIGSSFLLNLLTFYLMMFLNDLAFRCPTAHEGGWWMLRWSVVVWCDRVGIGVGGWVGEKSILEWINVIQLGGQVRKQSVAVYEGRHHIILSSFFQDSPLSRRPLFPYFFSRTIDFLCDCH